MASSLPFPQVDFCIALLGSGGVGKTSLLKTFLGQTFDEDHLPTVDDYYVHTLLVDGRHFTICFVDTAGSYSFPVMRKLALTMSHGFIVVYALDDLRSFVEATSIMDQISELKGKGLDSVPVVLVGNKLDIDMSNRKVSPQKAHEAFATLCRLEGQYLETSVKTNWRVEKAFSEVIGTLIYKANVKERQLGKLDYPEEKKDWQKDGNSKRLRITASVI